MNNKSEYGHKAIKNEETGKEQEVLRLNKDYFTSEEFDTMTTEQVEENFPDNKENYYACYQYYNKRKRRLSCFSRVIDGELEVFIWECDKKDTFTKEIARSTYENYIEYDELLYRHYSKKENEDGRTVRTMEFKHAHPKIFTIPLEGKHPKTAFLHYLSENYKRRFPLYRVVGYQYFSDNELWREDIMEDGE